MDIDQGLHRGNSALAGKTDCKEALLDHIAMIHLVDVTLRRISIYGDETLLFPRRNQIVFYVLLAGRCKVTAVDEMSDLDAHLSARDAVCLPNGATGRITTGTDWALAVMPSYIGKGTDDIIVGTGPLAARILEVQARSPTGHPMSRVMPCLLPAREVVVRDDPLLGCLPGLTAGDLHFQRCASLIAETLYLRIMDRHFDEYGASELVDQSMRCPPVARAVSLIQMNPRERWTIDLLAQEVGMSRSALLRRFMKIVGATPTAFLREHRLDAAHRLLHSSAASISDIADQVGFESASAFSAAFLRRYGYSPSGLRPKLGANGHSGAT